MYFVMYDKDLKALGVRKTYPVSKWNISRKAYDFDSCKITGYPIEFDVKDAMFVSLNEDDGKIKYTALVGISSVKDKVTTINCSDLKTILNSETLIDFTQTFNSVSEIYKYLINSLVTNNNNFFGFSEFTIIDDDIKDISFDPSSIISGKEIGNVWLTLVGLNQYYNLYLDMAVDFVKKQFKVYIKRTNIHRISINKEDFNLDLSQKVNTGINRAVCINKENTVKKVYYLLKDNQVIEESQLLDNSKIIYPAKIKMFMEDDINAAVTNGKKELLGARFDEKVEINVRMKLGYLFENSGFETLVNIIGYKELPIGEIKEDSSNNKSIILGIEKEEF